MTIQGRGRTALAGRESAPVGTLFKSYSLLGGCYDEMFASPPPDCRPHYQALYQRLAGLSRRRFDDARRLADESFLHQGITFTIYGDAQGTERVFPFGLIPRLIPADEWAIGEAGLIPRVRALNAFLHDVYHER